MIEVESVELLTSALFIWL